MAGIGAPELLIVLVVVLVLFGGAKLPGLARSLGEAGREFRKGASGSDRDERDKPDSP
ncbi:MAG: twin-arginine translocase TatA/TatE family subunit [Actinobacteria bacterium]|nr:twin-arginine translocase TatA/TatE family subunit [Actinomycetota bacterium]